MLGAEGGGPGRPGPGPGPSLGPGLGPGPGPSLGPGPGLGPGLGRPSHRIFSKLSTPGLPIFGARQTFFDWKTIYDTQIVNRKRFGNSPLSKNVIAFPSLMNKMF